ncbi:MAG: hypothetical protein ACLR30_06845 [[Clostridium] leptum]
MCDLPPVTLEGAPVSSTRIRKALESIARQARSFWVTPFPMISRWSWKTYRAFDGTPTLNQVFPEDYLVPRYSIRLPGQL